MKWAVFTYFHELLFIVRSLADAFERPTLRGCQCGGALDRVKALRPLPCPAKRLTPMGLFAAGLVGDGMCVLTLMRLAL